MKVTGKNTVAFSNVLIGDVWVCSGQSNMQFGLSGTKNAAAEIAAANYPEHPPLHRAEHRRPRAAEGREGPVVRLHARTRPATSRPSLTSSAAT